MSSLMQHHGGRSADGRKVELLMYLIYHDDLGRMKDKEPVRLQRPDGTLSTVPKLYRIYRRPVDMCGCWVVFRYNGEKHVPDLSVPIYTDKLPRDAKPLTDEEAAKYWFN